MGHFVHVHPVAGVHHAGSEEAFRLLREQAEQGVPFRGGVTEGLEDVAAALAVAELFVFEHAPGDADHVEEVPHGGGGVHVVFQRVHEGLILLFQLFHQLGGSRAGLPVLAGQRLVHFAQAFVDALLAALALVHVVEREVDGAAVVLPGEEVAQGFGKVAFEDVADGPEG